MKKLALSSLFGVLSVVAMSTHAELISQQPSSQSTVAQYATMPINQLAQTAQAGQAPAQFFLAERYKRGQGVAKDMDQAFAWFKKAADQNYIKSQYALGLMYQDGEGVRQDYAEARKWLGKACDNGSQDACEAYRILNQR